MKNAYEKGDLYMTILDLGDKSTEPAPKINLNPKFRDNE